ncbi:MAG: M14 family metallopeptidase [Nitrospinota bacterium]|nr:M14 family metallopeptidase [Nitrospinota bacterium]
MKTETLLSRTSPLGSSLNIVKQTFSAHRGKPVQRVSFVSGLHGDEFEGLYLCHRLIHALRQIQDTQPEAFKGEVHIIPAANPPALNHGTRLWPFYGSDMNRMMGPHPGASIPVQMSQKIFKNLKESSDLVVDIHASNLHLKELPQIRIIEEFSEELLPLALQTHTDIIWVHPMAGVFESTLGYNLNKLNIPTLVVETGICLRIEPDFVDRLFHGMMQLLHHQGVLATLPSDIPSAPAPQVVYPRGVGQSSAKHSGLFVSRVELGQRVGEDEIIGQILDPVEGIILEEVTAPGNGLLFTLRKQPAVHSGALLARVALDREPKP